MRLEFLLAPLLVAGCPLQAEAANWLQLQGNEAPDAPLAKFSAFVQPTYTYIDAVPLSGLQGASAVYNGSYTTSNLNWPQLQTPHQFQFMRAVASVRGRLTDNINYTLALDAGDNSATYYHHTMLTDASLTFNYIPGARIRAGLFKLPTSEEALLAVNASYPYVYYSNAGTYLVTNIPVTPAGAVNLSGTTAANLATGYSGFRDWGIQVYDWFDRGDWEFSYAAMLSNGASIEKPQDQNGNKDLTLRLQASRIFGGLGPNREDFSVFAWQQGGKRRFGTQDFEQRRAGVGLKYLRGDYRITSEYLVGSGMIVAGPTPPFVGNPFAVGVNEKAGGWYLEGGWRIRPEWELDLRYDYFDFMTQTAANEREYPTTTLGLKRYFGNNVHLIFNYEWRRVKVSNPGAIAAGAARDNALAIAGNIGNRASLQLTWSF